MAMLSRTFVLLLVATTSPAGALKVTPVEKVIELLESLHDDVVQEGVAEAETYERFSLYCKDSTDSTSSSALDLQDVIGEASATLEHNTQVMNEQVTELAERKKMQEQLARDKDEAEATYAKQKAEFEAAEADYTKAISSLESAMAAMEKGGATRSSLLQVQQASLQRTLAIASAMGLLADDDRVKTNSFLQVDPVDPTYEYHSTGIMQVLENLHKEFVKDFDDLKAEWEKTSKVLAQTRSALTSQMEANQASIEQTDVMIRALQQDIAESRQDLVNSKAALKDKQLFLTDLTKRCEVRAKDWDQRANVRSEEIKALAGALEIMKSKAAVQDQAVGQRAVDAVVLAQTAAPVRRASRQVDVRRHGQEAPSLLQVASEVRQSLRGSRGAQSQASESRLPQAVALLGDEGRHSKSVSITLLASQASRALAGADPFLKVKTLIQKLIERLLAEATAEATKQGFCDEEIGKGRNDRDARSADAKALDLELAQLDLKKDELEQTIELSSENIRKLDGELVEATNIRQAESAENVETIKTAKDGVESVAWAIQILKTFYKDAGKANMLQVRESPIMEDMKHAGVEEVAGAYSGKQERAKGIIGMLEVIKADFDRTDRHTEAAEKEAHKEFIEFDRVSKASISRSETQMKLSTEDLATVEIKITQKFEELQIASDRLDSALNVLEELRPTCVDVHMSYEERVEAREREIEALQKAVEILSP